MSNLDKYSRTPKVRISNPDQRRSMSPLAWLTVALGHPTLLIGWFVLGVTLAVSIGVGMNSDAVSLVTMRGELRTTTGRITASERTNMSEGGSDNRPGTPIYKYTFKYRDNRTIEREGISYTLGDRLSEGESVTVEFREDNPELARVEGARMRPFGAGLAFVWLFPVSALVLITIGLRLGLKRTSALAGGKLAKGKLIEKKPTNTQINNQRVYALYFRFEVDGKEHICKARTHRTALLEDDEEEMIIYNPSDPSKSIPIDILPAGMVCTESGQIRSPRPAAVLITLGLPIGVAVFNVFLFRMLV